MGGHEGTESLHGLSHLVPIIQAGLLDIESFLAQKCID
jgi:hypothetical protein